MQSRFLKHNNPIYHPLIKLRKGLLTKILEQQTNPRFDIHF